MIWKAIPGFSRYEASDEGDIRSLYQSRAGHGGIALRKEPKVVGKYLNKNGYVQHRLKGDDGKFHCVRAHRLVLETFVGTCPKGMECAHLNGIRADNRLENLTWATSATNHEHARIHGTLSVGARAWNHKLDDTLRLGIVLEIGRKSQRTIARQFGVSQSTVWRAIHNV